MSKQSGKTSKASKTSKKQVVEETPVVTEVEEKVEQVAEQVATEVVNEITMTDEERFDQQLSAFMESMKAFTKSVRETMASFQLELRALSTQSKKLRKKTRKRTRGNNSPNGFTKTVSVSAEILKFCGKPSETQMSRNEVNQFIHSYIREHNLQNPENKRQIIPDNKLKKILDLTKLRSKKELLEVTKEKAEKNEWSSEKLETELAKVTDKEYVNYFNLQRLVNHHYL